MHAFRVIKNAFLCLSVAFFPVIPAATSKMAARSAALAVTWLAAALQLAACIGKSQPAAASFSRAATAGELQALINSIKLAVDSRVVASAALPLPSSKGANSVVISRGSFQRSSLPSVASVATFSSGGSLGLPPCSKCGMNSGVTSGPSTDIQIDIPSNGGSTDIIIEDNFANGGGNGSVTTASCEFRSPQLS